MVEKIVGFNPHVVVQPYETSLDKKKFKNEELKRISNKIILSNNSEAIVINKDYTKGVLLRGYSKKSFAKLEIVKNDKFIGNYKEPIPAEDYEFLKKIYEPYNKRLFDFLGYEIDEWEI